MNHLLASIFSSSMIYVIFRVAKNYHCKLSLLITLNYLSATILGIILFKPFAFSISEVSGSWLPFAAILGVLFILMFYLIGTSSQKAGITVTTLANKLSLVFPVLFSLLYFNEEITLLKTIGIGIAFVAIVLTVLKKDINKTNILFIVLPVVIFIGSGLVDSIVKYVQAIKINNNEVSLYTTAVFFVSFLCGLILSVFRKKKFVTHTPTIILGVLLGLANFGSLYFLIKALNSTNLTSALVFTINNMSIVCVSALIGIIVFKEKFRAINFAGLILAVISLYFLMK